MNYEGDRNMKRRELQQGPTLMDKMKGKVAIALIGVTGLGAGGVATASANGETGQVNSGTEVSKVVGDSMTEKADAAGATATRTVEYAQTSGKRKPMKPVAIKQYTFKKGASYNRPGDQRPTKITLTQNSINIRGKCSKKNPYRPAFRFWAKDEKRAISVACRNNQKTVYKYPNPDGDSMFRMYNPRIQRVAKVVAKSAGVTPEMRGDAKQIVANNGRAALTFNKPEADQNIVDPVKKIVFKKRGKKTKVAISRYPSEVVAE